VRLNSLRGTDEKLSPQSTLLAHTEHGLRTLVGNRFPGCPSRSLYGQGIALVLCKEQVHCRGDIRWFAGWLCICNSRYVPSWAFRRMDSSRSRSSPMYCRVPFRAVLVFYHRLNPKRKPERSMGPSCARGNGPVFGVVLLLGIYHVVPRFLADLR